MILSAPAERCLRASGWTPERSIDAAPIIAALTQEGYVVNDETWRVVQNLGELEISVPNVRAPGHPTTVHFDARRALSRNFRENIGDYERRLGRRLTPVGEAFGNYMVILLSETGEVYLALDDEIVAAGGTLAEALDNLCGSQDFMTLSGL